MFTQSNQVISLLANINNTGTSQGLIMVHRGCMPKQYTALTSIPFKILGGHFIVHKEDLDEEIFPECWTIQMLMSVVKNILGVPQPHNAALLKTIAHHLEYYLDIPNRSLRRKL